MAKFRHWLSDVKILWHYVFATGKTEVMYIPRDVRQSANPKYNSVRWLRFKG